jgi:hypothetical protein
VSRNAAVARAVAVARDNRADGSAVAIQTSDVELGNWDSVARVFQAGGAPTDAVRVTARRTAATNNAVPLVFATVLGIRTCDVTTRAVAACGSNADGIVGIDSISMSSHGATDSYNSALGHYAPGRTGDRGNIRTNGDISLSGKVDIRGDARPGPGRSVSQGPGVTVSGSTAPLASALRFPPVDGSEASASNNNLDVPSRFLSGGRFSISGSDSVRLPGGRYYFTEFRMSENAKVDLDGPVEIYVAGDVTLDDGARAFASRPVSLKFLVVGDHDVEIKTAGDVHAVIYAPQGSVLVGGNGHLFGSVVGKTLSVNAHGGIHFDESLGTAGPAGVLLVK